MTVDDGNSLQHYVFSQIWTGQSNVFKLTILLHVWTSNLHTKYFFLSIIWINHLKFVFVVEDSSQHWLLKNCNFSSLSLITMSTSPFLFPSTSSPVSDEINITWARVSQDRDRWSIMFRKARRRSVEGMGCRSLYRRRGGVAGVGEGVEFWRVE